MLKIFFLSFTYLFLLSITAKSQTTTNKPKLIIVVVADQLRYEYLQRFDKHFSKGGFKKLETYGANCINANLNYSYSHNSTSYASISSGTTPSNHGIIANSWYNRYNKTKQNSIFDADQTCVGCNQAKNYQVSPKKLTASTFSDELIKYTNGNSKCFSISLEPNPALFLAGQNPTAAFWLDDISGNWVSTSYYKKPLPNWLTSFNNKRFADIYLQRSWNTIMPINYYSESLSDSSNFEIGIANQTVFPYNIFELKDKYKPYKILKSVPFGNTFTKDLAIEIIENEQLGKDNITDLLQISFTTTEEIGNKFGSQSKEIQDAIIRFDYELMFFINYLETYIGKENFLLVLTSSSGVSDSPKFLSAQNMNTGIFKHVESMYLLDKYLDTMFGNDTWILHYQNQQVYLNHDVIQNRNISLPDFQDLVAEFLLQLSGIHSVVTASNMEKGDFCTNNFEQKLDNCYNKERSGDLFIQLKPGWCEQSTDVVASHISGYTYDTHVPLLWYGWKIKPQIITENVNSTDIVSTLCSFISIPLPNMANGKIIPNLIYSKDE